MDSRNYGLGFVVGDGSKVSMTQNRDREEGVPGRWSEAEGAGWDQPATVADGKGIVRAEGDSGLMLETFEGVFAKYRLRP